MADNRTKEQRSYNMSKIRSKNTKPELVVRKFLFKNGFRFRLHSKELLGKPDIIIHKFKTVIFVHGCFWHGHENCKYAKKPVNNAKFWMDKILGNKQRDKRTISALKKLGWKVYIIWECQLSKGKVDKTLNRVLKKLSVEY